MLSSPDFSGFEIRESDGKLQHEGQKNCSRFNFVWRQAQQMTRTECIFLNFNTVSPFMSRYKWNRTKSDPIVIGTDALLSLGMLWWLLKVQCHLKVTFLLPYLKVNQYSCCHKGVWSLVIFHRSPNSESLVWTSE